MNFSNKYGINFVHHSVKYSVNIVFSSVLDVSSVCEEDIKFILPNPISHGKTKRQQSFIFFKLIKINWMLANFYKSVK